jgi:hypothetical protein
LACIGSLCFRQCVHGAPIVGGTGLGRGMARTEEPLSALIWASMASACVCMAAREAASSLSFCAASSASCRHRATAKHR